MLINPAVVTPDGDIDVPNQGTVLLSLVFKNGSGTLQDVSAKSLFFITSRGFRKALTNGLVTSEKVLEINQGELEESLAKPDQFVVRDETTTDFRVRWEGRIFVRGWSNVG